VVAPQAVQEVAAVSAATARTETLVETVNQIVEAVVGQLVVTPSLVQGEGAARMTLKPTVLDGSDITLSAKGGTLTVAVAPATPSAEQAVTAALPRLEIALAEHAPAFRHVEVALAAKRGKIDEVA
jgi:flagellar hook-length control protein FliK